MYFMYTYYNLKKLKKIIIYPLCVGFLLSMLTLVIYYITKDKIFIKTYYFIAGINASFFIIPLLWVVKNIRGKSVITLIGFFIMATNFSLLTIIIGIGIKVSFFISYLPFLIIIITFANSLIQTFNQEHYELEELNITLEQKVLARTKQLEQANLQIKDASEQKTTFFINLSHETKTPLTLITNYLDKDIKSRGSFPEIKIVKQNVNKLLHDMVNFLDIEKLNKGQIFYNHKEINNFSEVLRIKLLMFNETAAKKNITITASIESNIFIEIDNYALDRIINNFLDNAIKYTEHGGKIEVALKSNNDKIEFIVKDTGIGIPENKISHIFEPYYQLSHDKRNVQGIGMGLSIAKNIIDEVKGKIEVISKKNEGSTFKITFDKYFLKSNDKIIENIKYQFPIDDITEVNLAKEEYNESRNNILIVEDNLEMLSCLQENFKNNYNVFYSQNGKDALEKLKNIPIPHIIIADIMMDKMDGYEFHDNIKKDDTLKNIPFIFLTAKSGADEKLKGLSKGAIDFIAKPFSINELLIKVKNLMENKVSQEKNILESIYETTKKQLKEIKIIKVNYNKIKEKYFLTDKEIEVIKLIQEKLPNKEIAVKLNLSESTVKNKVLCLI